MIEPLRRLPNEDDRPYPGILFYFDFSLPDLAQEYISHLPGSIAYTEEAVRTSHGDMILIGLERPHESGEACFAVLPHVDGQPVIAKGYPENAQTRQLCEIFHKSMATYTITMASDKSD